MTLDSVEEKTKQLSNVRVGESCYTYSMTSCTNVCVSQGSSQRNRLNLVTNHRCSNSKMVICVVTVIVLHTLVLQVSGMPRTLLCDSRARCLHGGKLRLPDTPFGFCRCVCQGPYVGPRCQFNRLNRTRRINRLKRLVRLKQQFSDWLKNINSSER